jgi:hypothetical protein
MKKRKKENKKRKPKKEQPKPQILNTTPYRRPKRQKQISSKVSPRKNSRSLEDNIFIIIKTT